jgi:transglutaminase-like putative cysteine protease
MCNRLPLLLAAVVLHAQAALAGPTVRTAPLPQWFKPFPLTLDEESQKPVPAGAAGLEYLVLDEQTDVATSANVHHVAYRVTADSCLSEGSQIDIGFDPEYQTLELHFLRLWRDGRPHDRLDLETVKTIQQERDLERLIYNGRLTALILMPDVRVGDVVEYAFTRRGRNPVLEGQFVDRVWRGWERPVRHQRYRLVGLSSRVIRARAVKTGAVTESVANAASPEWTWEEHDVAPHVHDEGTPSWFVNVPYVELSEFSSWGHVVRWALPLYAAHEAPEVRTTAARLTRQRGSAEDKVLALLDFVQRDVRYLGIELGPGSHQPRLPEQVLDRRFGDCKDKARLLCALLREIRVQADPVLVHSSRMGTISSDLPGPYSFNHVIVRVRIAGRDYWVDPTASSQRGRLESRGPTTASLGLVVAPGSQGLTRIPAERGSLPRVMVEETYDQRRYEDPARFVVVYRFLGEAADRQRSYLNGSTIEEVSRAYLSYFKDRYPDLVEKSPPRWADDESVNVVRLELRYELPRPWLPLPGRKNAFEADFTPRDLVVRMRQPPSLARKSPLSLDYPDSLNVTTTINLPDEWGFEPSEHRMDTSFVRFQARTQARGSTVRFSYDWDSIVDNVSPGKLSAYVADLESVRTMTASVLTRDPDAARFALNWVNAGLGLGTIVVGGWVAVRTYRRPSEVASRPTPPPGGILTLFPAEPPATPAPEAPEAVTGEAPVTSSPETTPPSSSAAAAGLPLGGWLVLPALNLIVRPWTVLYPMVTNAGVYFDRRVWAAYTTPGSPDYSPGLAALLAYEVFANVGLLVLGLFAAFLFFGRRREAPRVMIGLFAASLLTMAIDFTATFFVPGANVDAQTAKDMSRTAVGALIWIPYFLVSQRVRDTFVR